MAREYIEVRRDQSFDEGKVCFIVAGSTATQTEVEGLTQGLTNPTQCAMLLLSNRWIMSNGGHTVVLNGSNRHESYLLYRKI